MDTDNKAGINQSHIYNSGRKTSKHRMGQEAANTVNLSKGGKNGKI